MLTIKNIYKLQTNYGVSEGKTLQAEVTIEEYIDQCRIYITNNLPEEYTKGTMSAEKKKSVDQTLISQFVDKHKVLVEGYITAEGILDTELLLEDVVDAVSGAGILREALEDPEVDEIQINDKNTIFVQKGGVLVPYVDSKGRVMRFTSNDEIHIILNKLIDDGTGNQPQFTPGNPILNAKTAKEQYRVSAVHFDANTRDKPPYDFDITTVVIRKFKEVKLTVDDIIESQAITPKMGRLLTLLGQAELKLFCVGPTGSGKTTLLNIIASTIPLNKRIILVQNPAEITFKDRDEYGRNKRNVVHWEVITAAKLDALTSNTLRFTPEIIIVGEAREKEEFFQIFRAAKTGHKILGTYHAENTRDAIERFASEYSSNGGSTNSEALRSVAKTIDIIITQFKFPDGRRRVMSIAEVEGVDREDNVKYNTLFEFKLTGEVETNEYGLADVKGKFVQVGTLSEHTKDALFKAGITAKTIAEFCDKDNLCAYSPEDIEYVLKKKIPVVA